MASTVQGLREILFNVKPPKELVNRDDEMVLVSQECLDILKSSSKDRGARFYQKCLDKMVSYFKLHIDLGGISKKCQSVNRCIGTVLSCAIVLLD